jgi:hypothetical protein
MGRNAFACPAKAGFPLRSNMYRLKDIYGYNPRIQELKEFYLFLFWELFCLFLV